jgi:hypothetical protein
VRVSPIARLGAVSLGAGSVFSAAFLLISQGQTAGAVAMMSSRWLIAHNLHFMGAALLVFGVVGLYLEQEGRLTAVGHLSFVLALMGSAFFFADGILTAGVLPFVAMAAPRLADIHGPLFHPPLPILVVSGMTFELGWLAFGWTTARAGVFPTWMGTAIAAGAVLLATAQYPFGPLPWSVAAVGGVVMALGMVAIAARVWNAVPTPSGGAVG